MGRQHTSGRPALRIMSVVGARPNFMKIAPFVHAIDRHNAANTGEAGTRQIAHFLVHTGQHYDERMSASFFDALDIPRPDTDLEIGSGSHATQVGQTMIAFERTLQEWKPDWVVVVGDVNATCACSITAKKEHTRLAHIEAGLRSYDLAMPEEINRMVTDRLSDLLLTPDALADANLAKEGVAPERIVRIGNVMIDTLEAHRDAASQLEISDIVHSNALLPLSNSQISEFTFPISDFALMTLHRPSNVDSIESLRPMVRFFVDEVAAQLPLLWTVHPRTEKQLKTFGLWEELEAHPRIVLLNPLGYHEMLRLNMGSRLMLTDSGGLQEECCVLGTPCITLRFNTERPVTLEEYGGLSVLTGNAIDRIRAAFKNALAKIPPGAEKQECRPPLWDGHAAERAVRAILKGSES